jgi:hypothetical protein
MAKIYLQFVWMYLEPRYRVLNPIQQATWEKLVHLKT